MAQRSRSRRSGLFFPLLLVAFGILFLLVNLGVVGREIWRDVWRFWPVLLILLGLDLLGGRGSVGRAVGSLFSVLVLVGAAFALFHLFAPDAWITEVQSLSQPLNEASEAQIVLACDGCSMTLDGPSSQDTLIEGAVTLRRDDRLHQAVRVDSGVLRFELKSNPLLPFLLTASRSDHVWDLRISAELPLELAIEAGPTIDLDLVGLDVRRADLSTENGITTLRLPETGQSVIYVAGDELRVRVPDNVGLRLLGAPTDRLVVPAGYLRGEGETVSPDYETADATVEILLRPNLRYVRVEADTSD